MGEKKKGLSGLATAAIVIFLVIRIAMIAGRNSSSSTHQTWNSSYLLWSVFLVIAVIGYYFYNKSKEKE